MQPIRNSCSKLRGLDLKEATLVSIEGSQKETGPIFIPFMADVTDAAKLHFRTYKNSEACGRRFLIEDMNTSSRKFAPSLDQSFTNIVDRTHEPEKEPDNAQHFAMTIECSRKVLTCNMSHFGRLPSIVCHPRSRSKKMR